MVAEKSLILQAACETKYINFGPAKDNTPLQLLFARCVRRTTLYFMPMK